MPSSARIWKISPGCFTGPLGLGPPGKYGPQVLFEKSVPGGKGYRRMKAIPGTPSVVTDEQLNKIVVAARVPERYRARVKPLIFEVLNSPYIDFFVRASVPSPKIKIAGRNVRTPLRRIIKGLRRNAEAIRNLNELQLLLFSYGLHGMRRIIVEVGRSPEFIDVAGLAVLLCETASALEQRIAGSTRPPHRPRGTAKHRALKFLIRELRGPVEELGHGQLSFSCDESGRNCSGPLVKVLEILRSSFPRDVIPAGNKLTRSILRVAKNY
jgi:hypothetical protein